MALRYSGKIEHTEKSIELLFKTEYYTFETMRMLVRMAFGFGLIVLALTVSMYMWLRAILMLIGCWLVVSKDFPSAARADRVIDARRGALPTMSYDFYEDHVRLSGEGSMNLSYGKFSRLIEDDGYFYLFISKDSVCMVDRATLSPHREEEFKKFIEKKTNLNWKRQKSLLSMNLQDLLQAVRDRKGPEQKGPRLDRRGPGRLR